MAIVKKSKIFKKNRTQEIYRNINNNVWGLLWRKKLVMFLFCC